MSKTSEAMKQAKKRWALKNRERLAVYHREYGKRYDWRAAYRRRKARLLAAVVK